MKTQRALTIAAITSALITMAGCTANGAYQVCTTANVNTHLQSYSASHEYQNILVATMGEFPGLLCDEFRQRDIGCLAYDQVFSPLEDYTTYQLHERILAGGFDSVMFVNDAVSSTNTNDLGSVSQIEPYSGTVTTTNITGFSRSDRFSVVVYDVSTDKKVYLANAETSGGGAMCVNDYVYLRSAAEKIAEDMLK